ncbi:hypothetical protein NLM16_27900 [Bradyrhizobium brasilense]|uniref:hypothetical protein n=1 Tax=Bradyrhizobium brasilense TaxID=1419277 RepID=UPI00287748E2|nr:hypothetical protein [Bradyrhizobium brasilense]MCP3417936.1 hypothetical protein [Bradyrhizobium brasilense]
MKQPKPLPAVERHCRISAASVGQTGVCPSMIATKTVGKQPSPVCRLLSEYRCS